MADYAVVSDWVEKELATNWADTPIVYENTEIECHEGAYIASAVAHGANTNIAQAGNRSLGPRMQQAHVGIILIDLFVPKGQGTKQLDEMSQKIENIFGNKRVQQYLQTFECSTRPAGANATHIQRICEITFERINYQRNN